MLLGSCTPDTKGSSPPSLRSTFPFKRTSLAAKLAAVTRYHSALAASSTASSRSRAGSLGLRLTNQYVTARPGWVSRAGGTNPYLRSYAACTQSEPANRSDASGSPPHCALPVSPSQSSACGAYF